jgi:hypothetical protein
MMIVNTPSKEKKEMSISNGRPSSSCSSHGSSVRIKDLQLDKRNSDGKRWCQRWSPMNMEYKDSRSISQHGKETNVLVIGGEGEMDTYDL